MNFFTLKVSLKLKFSSSFSYRIKKNNPSKHTVYKDHSKKQSFQLLVKEIVLVTELKTKLQKYLDNIHLII